MVDVFVIPVASQHLEYFTTLYYGPKATYESIFICGAGDAGEVHPHIEVTYDLELGLYTFSRIPTANYTPQLVVKDAGVRIPISPVFWPCWVTVGARKWLVEDRCGSRGCRATTTSS